MIKEETGKAMMIKEIAIGLIFIGGVAALAIGAEVALPAIAGIGAAASLGAGIAEAYYAPRKKDVAVHKNMPTASWHAEG